MSDRERPAGERTPTTSEALLRELAANPASRPIRLVGFGVSGFAETPPAAAPSLFGPDPADERAEKREALSRALDDIRSRLGASVRLG